MVYALSTIMCLLVVMIFFVAIRTQMQDSAYSARERGRETLLKLVRNLNERS